MRAILTRHTANAVRAGEYIISQTGCWVDPEINGSVQVFRPAKTWFNCIIVYMCEALPSPLCTIYYVCSAPAELGARLQGALGLNFNSLGLGFGTHIHIAVTTTSFTQINDSEFRSIVNA